MARTRLFAQLQRLLQKLQAPAAEQPNARNADAIARRRWLQGSLSVMGLGLVNACDDSLNLVSIPDSIDGGSDAGVTPHVAIIGGGMAGLHCAYRLKAAKVGFSVYEASKRVGGRMFTDRESFAPQVAELGGEFIDSGHTTLHTLAEEFDIQLDDREEDLDADTVRDLWWIDGAAVPDATVVEQFAAVAPMIAELVERLDVDEDEDLYAELDAQSLADWLDENVPPGTYPELHAILRSAYRGEYGLELAEQSSLNLVYLIGADEPDPFRIFGVSDERYHTHKGSQTFIDELESRLDSDSILREYKLVKASGPNQGRYSLEFDTPKGTKKLEATHVVFALPFSVLRDVDLSKLELPEEKQQMIDELGYGTNAKLIGAFKSRVWRTEHDASGSVTTDAAFQQCWDTSTGQAGEQGILTNFLGGKAGKDSDAGEPNELYTKFVAGLNAAFPGVDEAYVDDSAVRMHWPSFAFTKGSYACYRPGQWAFWSLEGEAVGQLYFCGEHTSLEFQGYMEGAAETGARAAGEILDALDITPSAVHRALLDLRRDLPRRTEAGMPRILARKRALRARLNAKLGQRLA